ncbi:TolC family protein [Brevundimonas variabilis]|uniref:Cobalt-zinc-cadmium efflux system outer membrane protein n=1 Tax=Brevundimonas variabilis TaxID=74312 RepID=A0A7W9FEG5_9CAUL|nr:TolC family protein [Brevundimonas variabilis]MBB5746307.1 cobalt-zinc-cadmium efflux system outer membrane protein [Brevundimonas variabilis]
MPPLKSGRSRLAIGCAVVSMATAVTGHAWADPAPSFEALLERIGLTPATVEAGALLDAAEARARQARVRPNPELGLEAENAFGSGPFSGYDNAETTLSLSQDLELWGRRGARVEVARADAGTAGLRRDLATVEAGARLALVYAEAEAAQRRFLLAEEALTVTIADTRAALILVEEGREPLLRGIQGESEAAAARATLDETEAERDAAFARLTAVAMLPTPVTSIDTSLIDRVPAAAAVTSGATPQVRVAEAERAAAETRIEVERIRAKPDVRASVGVRRYEAEDATALTFGLSVPLPLFDRNRGNIEAAQADFRAADARLMGARQEAEADRNAAVARLRASVSRVTATDAGVTTAEEAYRLSRIGFEAGRISQLELRSSRAALIAARNAAVDARLARVRAEIDLARLQGRAPFGTSL